MNFNKNFGTIKLTEGSLLEVISSQISYNRDYCDLIVTDKQLIGNNLHVLIKIVHYTEPTMANCPKHLVTIEGNSQKLNEL